MTTSTSIATILYNKIIEIIQADLTIGQTDNDLEPWSNIKINQFIEKYKKNIEVSINDMITDYERDGELDSLENPEYDMIREYLYKYVDTNVDTNPEISKILRNKIIEIIKDVVTIDDQESKYGIVSDTIEIDKYIELSEASMKDVIKTIITHHRIDGNLDSLYNPDYDMVYQYLFDSSEVF